MADLFLVEPGSVRLIKCKGECGLAKAPSEFRMVNNKRLDPKCIKCRSASNKRVRQAHTKRNKECSPLASHDPMFFSRRCNVCGEIKTIHDFGIAADQKDGLRGTCFRCGIWQCSKRRAAVSGVTFTIKPTDVIVPETCPVLGIRLKPNVGKRGPSDSSPSIDRMRPELGYIPGNIMVISSRANIMKGNSINPSELERVANYMRSVCGLCD